MITVRVKRNGREYVYSYDRSKYRNNSTEYNKAYYKKNKQVLNRKARMRRIDSKLSELSDAKVG